MTPRRCRIRPAWPQPRVSLPGVTSEASPSRPNSARSAERTGCTRPVPGSCRARLLDLHSLAWAVFARWDHRRVIFSVFYLLARCMLGCLMVMARHEMSKDAGLLVLRHQNGVLRRQTGRVRYQPGDRLWL